MPIMSTAEMRERFLKYGKTGQECFICREAIGPRQHKAEIKARVSGEWRMAHRRCAVDNSYEHYLLPSRLIRCPTTRKRLVPKRKGG